MRPLYYLNDPDVRAAERAVFIDAALKLLAHMDSLDLKVGDVVRAADRNNAIFYKLFGSRDGLIVAVVEHTTHKIVEVMRSRISANPTKEEAVNVWCRTLLALASPEHSSGSVLPMALDRHRILRKSPESEEHVVQPLKDALKAMLADGSLPKLRLDAAFELVMGTQATWLALEHRPTNGQIQEVADMVLLIVTTPTPPARPQM
jgi:AcrR family transcriptional regulator